MRLLNTTTLEFEEFFDTEQIRSQYSILSHCWSQDPKNLEVTHQAYLSKTYDENGAGYQKIRRCCELSRERGFEYTWIDTCCVDKTSSAELSETINSMFAWYRDSAECFVFMDDLAVNALPDIEEVDAEGRWTQGLGLVVIRDVYAFTSNRWFARGWTLQELLAPEKVRFFGYQTKNLGSKRDLAALVAYATGIHVTVITGLESIFGTSLAKRMSWASARQTTRREDIAYSLLGIFEVNMPLLYGEGDKAFMRLQKAIIRQSDDQSIFAWGLKEYQEHTTSVLAAAPGAFKGSGNIISSYHRKITLDPGFNRIEFSSGNNGKRFADMVSYDLVKKGLEICHCDVLLLHESSMSLNLNCCDMRGKTWETIPNVRLDLQMGSNGRWQRARIACENTRVRQLLDAWAHHTAPRMLYASLDDDLYSISKRSASDYGTIAWLAWDTFWMKMVPAQTLAIIAFMSYAIELSASNSVPDRATQWFLVGLIALVLASCQDTEIRMGRRLVLEQIRAGLLTLGFSPLRVLLVMVKVVLAKFLFSIVGKSKPT
ncbi:hypothetical protein LTR97_004694 [Elasticomyces elasticus]|uniref:Heterokaryon incompatibility domain-containing protein n=1 Tax=Elasticomyces elasticus TaxID=574655 RepID=A0AAN7ZP40_9PEZI|nr:hypothetical protein LTR97_004694 [Elasticomyces elasticus]